MRLLAAARVSRAATRRLAYCEARGRRRQGRACDLLSRDIQMTECVESAHEPVPVPAPVKVLPNPVVYPVPVSSVLALCLLNPVVLMPVPP